MNNIKLEKKSINFIYLKTVINKKIKLVRQKINSPEDCYQVLSPFINNLDREVLVLCCLDSANQPTSINIISIGSINSSIVHPREVYKTSILSNSTSIIIAHNHPSGNINPSNEDIEITNRLVEAGHIIGIKLLDHLIIGYKKYYSFKEEGMI